jgi:hypothetical protein
LVCRRLSFDRLFQSRLVNQPWMRPANTMPGTNAPFPSATVQILQVVDPVTNKPAGAPLAAGATVKAGQYVQACGAVNTTCVVHNAALPTCCT